MRIDKYLWSVRLYKTRSLSAKACSSEKVKSNGQWAKPGKEIKQGDRLEIKVTPIWRQFEVIALPKSRVGAKLVEEYLNEITPEEETAKLEAIRAENRSNRFRGIKGRPTKKDQRDQQSFRGDY